MSGTVSARIANDWNKTILVSIRKCDVECKPRYALDVNGKWCIQVKDLRTIDPNSFKKFGPFDKNVKSLFVTILDSDKGKILAANVKMDATTIGVVDEEGVFKVLGDVHWSGVLSELEDDIGNL